MGPVYLVLDQPGNSIIKKYKLRGGTLVQNFEFPHTMV